MSKLIELFGFSTNDRTKDWQHIVSRQLCPFIEKKCYKVRKSEPNISIGTCSVLYGKESSPVIICPSRLTENRQIFLDCLHLLSRHEPGNELHIVPEVSIPGGSVDFFLVSIRKGSVRDFVGIELQTLDTTGTVWPERKRFLSEVLENTPGDSLSDLKSFGMNWKMTAKTILVQMHHKAETFAHLQKTLVLVIQDCLLRYMKNEFNFSHLSEPALTGDTVQFHSYQLASSNAKYKLELDARLSTDVEGIGNCLGLQAEAKIELEVITKSLLAKVSAATLFRI